MIITIVGTGYVGLVTGAALASHGHTVRCVDVAEERIRAIQAGTAPFYEPGLDDLLQAGLASGRLSCTADLADAMQNSALSLIAVGTPAKGENPDLSYLQAAAAQIGAALPSTGGYHVVCVKSTVIPGTTRNVVQPILERTSGMRLGQFGLCMNPEFLREGSAVDDFMRPDRIVIGQADAQSGDVLDELYQCFSCEKPRVGLEEAELTKYASNSLLSVLISFSNELAGLCEATPGADVETILECLYLDRRLSPIADGVRIRPEILSYLRAGIGFGGSCLPKDVNALRVYGKQTGVPTPILDGVIQTNTERPARVLQMADKILDGLAGKHIAVLGIAFKSGTDDLRHSPALAIIDALRSQGSNVRAYDPFVPPALAAKVGLQGICADDLDETLRNADAAVITTVDPMFRQADWGRLLTLMRTPVVIDGRNVLRNVPLPPLARYYPIGRGSRSAQMARIVH